MRSRQRDELGLTGPGEADADDALIGGIDVARDETGALGSIDQLDHAVVAEEQMLGDIAHRRRVCAVVVATDGQQQLVLGGGEPDGPRFLLTPVQEAAQTIAKGQEAGEVVVRKVAVQRDIS
jgi:hypothetical protein